MVSHSASIFTSCTNGSPSGVSLELNPLALIKLDSRLSRLKKETFALFFTLLTRIKQTRMNLLTVFPTHLIEQGNKLKFSLILKVKTNRILRHLLSLKITMKFQCRQTLLFQANFGEIPWK
jgi:hypothetical protein